MKKIITIISLFLLPHYVQAMDRPSQIEIVIEPAEVGQGEIAVVIVKAAARMVEGRFNGRKIYFNPSKDSYKAIVGIDLTTEPGAYPLEVSIDGSVITKTITIATKEYPVQRLTLPKDMVELSPENEARVEREAQKLRAIWPNETERIWEGSFVNPRDGAVQGAFGLRRIINNIPKSPHTGIDVSADEGAEVRAPNNGIVALVDEQFYSGRSIILDHGQGIYTMFFHLSKILVSQGQKVKKGEVIGLVGSTGRSTGPHLHWGVRMQGARVDPVKLLNLKLE